MRLAFILVFISLGSSSFGDLDFSPRKIPECLSFTQKCRSVETAVQCSALKDCIPLWKNAKLVNLPENSVAREARYQPGGKCASCESISRAVEEMQEMKQQRRVTQHYLTGLCKPIKDADARDHCKIIVDRYFDAIFDMLAAHIDKGVACSLLDACAHRTLSFDGLDARHTNLGDPAEPNGAGLRAPIRPRMRKELQQFDLPAAPRPVLPTLSDEARVRAAWAPLEARSGSPAVCADCKRALDDLLDLADKSQSFIVNWITKNVCSSLGDFAEACNQSVPDFVRLAVDLIREKINTTKLCALARLCPLAHSTPLSGSKSSPTSCELCQVIISLLDNLIENNKTEENVIAALEKVCYIVPQKFRQTCDMFVDMYADVLIRVLLEDFSPDIVCAHLKLCLTENVPFQQPKLEANVGAAGAGSKCELCELFVSRIETYLTDKRTEQEVVEALDMGCLLLPKAKQGGYDLRAECQAIIQTYGPSIIELLVKSVTPAELCAALKLCDGDKAAPAPAKSPEQSPQCDICEQVVRQVEELIEQNKTEQSIVEALEKVCNLFPAKYRKECDDFVTQYADEIIKLLLQEMPPKEVCAALGLCSKQQKADTGRKEIEVKKSVQCELCEQVVGRIEAMIEQNKTEQAIVDALEKVCNLLPAKYRKECDDFVTQYAEEIIKLLLQDLTPEEVCTVLGLCSKQMKAATGKKDIEVKQSVQCELCKEVVGRIESMIAQNKTEQAIVQALEKVCNYLPAKYSKECDDFVDLYAMQIIELLLKELSAKEVCIELGLCSKTLKALVSEAAVILGGTSVSCDRCEHAVDSIKTIFSHKETVEEAKVVLKFLCANLGVQKSECDNLVEQWVPAFVNLVARVTAREVCVILDYCPASDAGEKKRADSLAKTLEKHISAIKNDMKLASHQKLNVQQSIVHLLSSSSFAAKVHIIPESKTESSKAISSEIPVTPCGLCIFVLHKVEKMIVTNRSEEALTHALEHVCSLMPAHARQECDQFVDKYFERVLDLFLQGVAPEAICMAVGLCETAAKARQTHAAASLELLPARNMRLAADLKYPCLACQFTAMQASMALFYEPYYKSIGAWFEKNLCSKLAYAEPACKRFIDSEVPQLLKQLGAKIDPTVTCENVKMCAPGENPPWLTKSKLGSQASDELCVACRYLEDLLRAYIEDLKNQNEIIDVIVNDGCNRTKDKDLERVCESLVRSLAPAIFMLVGDALDRDQACFALDICPNTTSPKVDIQPAKPQSDDECTSCKLGISEIRVVLLNPVMQDIIAKQLDTQVCPQLKPMDDVCRAYVKDYLPLAFTLLSKFLNAEAICTKMHFCKKSGEDTSELTLALPDALTRFQNNPEACQLCNTGLATVRALLLQPVVKNYLQAFVSAHVCNSMGEEYSQACLNVVRMEMPLVFDALNKLLTSDNVCLNFLRFCNKNSTTTSGSGSKDSDVCAGCKLLLTSARGLIQTHQTQILQLISQEVCPRIGGAAAECEDWVLHLGPLIVQSLLTELDPDTLCNELNLCGTGTELLSRILKSRMSDKESPEICMVCKFIVSEFHVLISKPAIQAKIESFLENKVCTLDKSFESNCKQFVKDQLPALLEALSNVLGDGRLCQLMKACDSGAGINFFGDILSKVSSGNICNDCKQLVNQVKNLLEDPNYEESLVKAIIQEVCPHMSKPTECELAVRLAGKRVIAQVAAQLNPVTICVEFKMCKSAYARLPAIEPPAASSGVCQRCLAFFAPGVCILTRMCPASVAAPRNDEECDLCKNFANEILTFAKQPQVRQEVLDFLHTEVCSKFGKYKDQCIALVDEYVTVIFEILSQMTPEDLCKLIGVCPSQLVEPADMQMTPFLLGGEPQPLHVPLPVTAKANGIECSLCKEIVSTVEGKLVQHTRVEVINYLITECNRLKYPDMRVSCDKFVNDSGQLVVDLIMQDLTPPVVCKFGGYCSSAVQLLATPNTPFSLHCAACRMLYSDAHCLYMRLCSAREGGSEPPLYAEAYAPGVRDSLECDLCEQLLQPVWVYLESPATIAQVAQLFENICNEKFLQPDMQGMCNAIVLELVNDAINAILDAYTPAWVCTNELHVCNSSESRLSRRIIQLRNLRKSASRNTAPPTRAEKPGFIDVSKPDSGISRSSKAEGDDLRNLIPRRRPSHRNNAL